ncbi:MAG: hypothetical protein WD851_04955 [Pirellulales bacterium]
MARARARGHLEALKEQFSQLLGECEILESAGTDYAFRLFVPKSAWMLVLAGLTEETDYDSFKSDVAHQQGRAGAAYEHSLHEVWSVILDSRYGSGCRCQTSAGRGKPFPTVP